MGANRGDGQPMTWATHRRKYPLPPDWQARTRAVKARSGGRCEVRENGKRCTNRSRDVDHVDRTKGHALTNLQDICTPHHKAKTAREAAAGRRHNSARREPERHPGLIP